MKYKITGGHYNDIISKQFEKGLDRRSKGSASYRFPLNLSQLRLDNGDGPGLSRETVDELIDYCEWIENYYAKPHKFEAGRVPSICGKCGRKKELHNV